MPLRNWFAEVDAWLTRSPKFFTGKPLVLDVSGLGLTQKDLTGLLAELAGRKIHILGLEGAEPEWVGEGVPPLLTGGRAIGQPGAPDDPLIPSTAPAPSAAAAPAPSPAAPAKPASSLLIQSPVRSGQTIINEDGDVTVVGSVASGAEIVAAGSIHIYGTLRGRALAGIFGDDKARIFCHRLEAELIAINGYYKVADELEPHVQKRSVHARLEHGAVQITALD
jgi:septum site-determining protein MinC